MLRSAVQIREVALYSIKDFRVFWPTAYSGAAENDIR